MGGQMATIRTDELSTHLRERVLRPDARQLLITRIEGTDQQADLSEPPNCQGYGRIRHFRMATLQPWPVNPLPIVPAARRLGLAPVQSMEAQVFQNAACNWRCWYCYVPFSLLAGNASTGAWLSAEQLIDLYLAEAERPKVIDCSGGQPDLVPEWIPWMIEALHARGIAESVYLWSDDNLSNDYFFRFLTRGQTDRIVSYSNYGRVCCFKGYSATSFAFNTRADEELFTRQFELFGRLLAVGIDLYGYATFTSPTDVHLYADMRDFVDRLQAIHRLTPLRVVPLRIETFGVVQPRVRSIHETALAVQEEAIQAWTEELGRRFGDYERNAAIVDPPFRS
jgi:uncharacterized Fe-S cluster-containing radical SAM superfamily protein